ncbi:hypothetical protein [Thermicanus aegyptius]|uniref:hypothetical protein n=1 Tax=Thermicanus aegyptius TaxID=94009 RepID=UPI00041DC4A0|nr:hypothetical protein [Thermicanus aegyptius]
MTEIEKKPISLGKSTSIKIKKDKYGRSQGRYYGETEANKVITAFGTEIYNNLTDVEREKLGNMSGTLHFVRLLGLASKKSYRSLKGYKIDGDNNDRDQEVSTPVGIELISDVDITVPVIKMELVKELMRKKRSDEPPTYIDPKRDVGSREIKANEYFSLSLYEFLFLIIRDEYAGLLRRDDYDDDWGVNITFKWVNSIQFYSDGTWELKSKIDESGNKSFVLPTPSVNYFARGTGGPKASMVDIDHKGENGWVIKPEYQRFEPLLKRKTRSDKGRKRKARGVSNAETDTVKVIKKQSSLARKKV